MPRHPVTQHTILEIRKGNIPEHEIVTIFAENNAVGTGSRETLWAVGGEYAFPSSAIIMKVSSSDANDTSDGTGAQTVKVEGLDGSYEYISETVSLNGQTEVNTVQQFLRVNNLCVETTGSSNKNAGSVYIGEGTVTGGVPATAYSVVSPGDGIDHVGVYTVRNKHKLMLLSFDFSVVEGKSAEVSSARIKDDRTEEIHYRVHSSGGINEVNILEDGVLEKEDFVLFGLGQTQECEIDGVLYGILYKARD